MALRVHVMSIPQDFSAKSISGTSFKKQNKKHMMATEEKLEYLISICYTLSIDASM